MTRQKPFSAQMITNPLHFLRCWLCVVLLVLSQTVGAADNFGMDELRKLNEQLDTAEKTLTQSQNQLKDLEALQSQAVTLEQTAQTCISQYTEQQTIAQKALDSIGAATPNEDLDLKNKRKQLETQKQQTDKMLAQCRLTSLRASTLNTNSQKASQTILQKQLFAPSASLLTHSYNLLFSAEHWKADISVLFSAFQQLLSDWKNVAFALLYGFFGATLILMWSLHKRTQYRAEVSTLHLTSPTLNIVWRSLLQSLPFISFAGIVALTFHAFPPNVLEVQRIFIVLFSYHISMALLRSLLRTSSKIEGLVPIDKRTSREINVEAQLLLLTTLAAVIFHWSALDNSIVENSTTDNTLVGLIRIGCATVIGFALTRLVWLAARHILFLRKMRLHILVTLASLGAVSSAWMGYPNFANFLFQGMFGTLVLMLFAWLILQIPSEILDGLDDGRADWQKHLRQRLNLKDGQLIPGLVWLRITHSLLIAGIVGALLLYLWGMSEQSLKFLFTRLVNGIDIGSFTLEPIRILGGLLAVAVLISLSQMFKQYLADTWLRHTTLSKGAREATTTISGYAGIVLAILMGLSIAGIEFKNLAIIAGALSVGIGFGLQNIVNNFVSGLILLFERPIRKGDWIKVGNAEGYVRDISIRSTTIQTFDRSDIIVPNSEIISGQVTNMMLNDNFGRIIIPISVAHGTNTETVMQCLREVAQNHPSILKDHPEMKILVFFKSFSDTALNFELRCFVREIESRTGVISDLNLAIDRVFREQRIELPSQAVRCACTMSPINKSP